jgi:zinc and cadmium transporter
MLTAFWWALGSAFVVSLISLVGLAAMTLREDRVKGVVFILISLAAGALFGDAILHLLPEIFRTTQHPVASSLWVLAGIISSFVLEKFLRWRQEHGFHPHDHIHPVGRIILVSDGLHNLMDGVLIGASYLAGRSVGMATTMAVILHELPHEIGDFGVLLHSGYSRSKALLFNFLSACIAIGGVGIAFGFQSALPDFPAIALPVTAGSFLYIAGTNLTPELHKENSPLKSLLQFIALLTGVSFMLLLLLVG